MPLLERLEKRADCRRVPERFLRASDLGGLGDANNPEWQTLAYDEASGELAIPNGPVGFRWGEKGKWNIEEKDRAVRAPMTSLNLKGCEQGNEAEGSPYFRGIRLH